MRSYNGPRNNNNCKTSTSQQQQRQKLADEDHVKKETSDDIPNPILGELGPPPGPDLDLSGKVVLGRSSIIGILITVCPVALFRVKHLSHFGIMPSLPIT